MTGVNPPSIPSRFDYVAPKLYNLEPYSEPEKPLNIELDIYQMEHDCKD
jgi:hypothetical protein